MDKKIKLMVGGILTVVTITLIVFFSFHINSADKCQISVDPSADRTVFDVAIKFHNETWGEMDELEKATLFDKCKKEMQKTGKLPNHYMIYAKNHANGELVFTCDSEKGLVEVGNYATEKQ